MNHVLLSIILFCVAAHTVSAQDERPCRSPRSEGMAFATVASAEFDNPASLVHLVNTEFAFGYSNRYMLSEFSYLNASFAHHLRYLDWGVQAEYTGFSLYNNTRLLLSGAKRLSSRWALGVRVSYHSLYLVNEEVPFSMVGADIGITYEPHSTVRVAMLVHNVMAASIGFDNNPLSPSACLRLGVSYRPVDGFEALLEAERTLANGVPRLLIRLGAEYYMVPELPLRFGLLANGLQPSFGVGYRFAPFAIDVSANYHFRMGLSVGVGVKMQI